MKFDFSHVTHHVWKLSLLVEKKQYHSMAVISSFHLPLIWKYSKNFKFSNVHIFSKIWFFEFWKWFLGHTNFEEPQIDIIWYTEACIFDFYWFSIVENFQFSFFIKKRHKKNNCKIFAIFQIANNYLNGDYESYLLKFLSPNNFGIFKEF